MGGQSPIGANLRGSQISRVLIQRWMTDFFPDFDQWDGFISSLNDVILANSKNSA